MMSPLILPSDAIQNLTVYKGANRLPRHTPGARANQTQYWSLIDMQLPLEAGLPHLCDVGASCGGESKQEGKGKVEEEGGDI
jgi:hypothetical protein